MKLIYKSKILSDNATVESAGINESGFVVLHTAPKKKETLEKKDETPKVKENPKTETLSTPKGEKMIAEDKMPPTQPLPGIIRKLVNPDPPNFKENVEKLVAMGFNEGDCECALRSAVGNLERATDYLISGYIPDVPHLITSDIPVQEPKELRFSDEDEVNSCEIEEEDNGDSIENLLRLRDEFIRDPEALKSFLNQMATDNPSIAGFIQDDPASFLTSIGFNPNDFDLTGIKKTTQYEQFMSKFTKEEQESIHSLEKLGYDTMVIIQVFEACDKDLEVTKSCLSSMF